MDRPSGASRIGAYLRPTSPGRTRALLLATWVAVTVVVLVLINLLTDLSDALELPIAMGAGVLVTWLVARAVAGSAGRRPP